jgi:serine/threonine protein kinase
MKYEQAAYTAPEIRKEYSGRTLLPEVDVYGLGALLSYLLTDESVRPVVENPLTEDAYRRLEDDLPTQVRSIIGKCLQPLAKNRFSSFSEIPALDTGSEAADEKLQDVELPEPFEGAEHQAPGQPGISENLSPGPLVGRSEQDTEPESEENAKPVDGDQRKMGGLILLGLIFVVALLIVLF